MSLKNLRTAAVRSIGNPQWSLGVCIWPVWSSGQMLIKSKNQNITYPVSLQVLFILCTNTVETNKSYSHLQAFVKEGKRKRKRLPPKHRFRVLSLLTVQLVAQQMPCSEVGCCCLWIQLLRQQSQVCSCFFRNAASCLPIRAASYKIGLALLEGYLLILN